jgi:thiamine kinase-like enzyme
LGRAFPQRFAEHSLASWLSVWEQQLDQYLSFLGERISQRRRETYERTLPDLLDRLLRRRAAGEHYTITHNDAHQYNFLFPHNAATRTTRLVDWATWDVEAGPRDLAYLLALHFFPEQRTLMEQPLLRRYHQRLIEQGVQGYSWEKLWEDYRLFVGWNLFIPVEQAYWNVPASIWWPHVERSFLAFEDLGCEELFG